MRTNGNIRRICITCGREFLTWTSKTKDGQGIFCQKTCRRRPPKDPVVHPVEISDDGIARIPLRDRDGSVRAYALIDIADADWASQWRWCLDPQGYATRSQYVRTEAGGGVRTFRLHRELLGLTSRNHLEVDHINRDRLDNRRSNLRPVTHMENGQNVGGIPTATSQYRGVSWYKSKQKWVAQIFANGKKINLGYFVSEEEAAEVARTARGCLLPYAVD